MVLETFLCIGFCGDMVTEEQLLLFFTEVDKDGVIHVLRHVLRILGRLNHGKEKPRLRICRVLVMFRRSRPVMVKVTPRRVSLEYARSRDPLN